MVTRKERERFLAQKARVIWLTGLSGSGKTTLALDLEQQLFSRGHFSFLLDGDNIRSGINRNLGFSEEEREENIRRIAEVARLFLDSGTICICCFVSPLRSLREMARNIVGPEDFIEVFLDADLEVCEQRDVKGLYKLAREGRIPDFTGISAPFEAPESPNLVIPTGRLSLPESGRMLLDYLIPRIRL